MISFEDLVSRADSAWLQERVGASTVRVLQALDQDNQRARVMREVFIGLSDPRAMLTDPGARVALIELLRPSEAAQLASVLGLEGDPYAVLGKVPLPEGSERHQLCAAFLGLSERQNEPFTPTPSVQRVPAMHALFPHQSRAVLQVSHSLYSRSPRVVLHMPTGAGKTRMAMHVVARHLNEHEATTVIWLANSEELCEQAAEEFERAWKYLGNRDTELYRLWGQRSLAPENLRDGLLIAGFSKLYSQARSSPPRIAALGDRVSLIVVDEAHQAIAPTYRLLIDGLTARKDTMPVLGLTATPGRTWNDPEADRRLAEYFFKNKVTLQVPGYASPVDFLVSEGYLAEPEYRRIEHLAATLSDSDLTRVSTDLDIPQSVLSKLAADEVRTLKIVREIEALATRHRRIILFATTVEHAVTLGAVLRARGIATECVTGQTQSAERARAISWFKAEDESPRVLANFGVLTTGFDAPRTSSVLIARPTKSLVLYSQMVGRAIRGPRAGGNVRAEIVTVVDTNLPGFGDLAAAFTNWEDVW